MNHNIFNCYRFSPAVMKRHPASIFKFNSDKTIRFQDISTPNTHQSWYYDGIISIEWTAACGIIIVSIDTTWRDYRQFFSRIRSFPADRRARLHIRLRWDTRHCLRVQSLPGSGVNYRLSIPKLFQWNRIKTDWPGSSFNDGHALLSFVFICNLWVRS